MIVKVRITYSSSTDKESSFYLVRVMKFSRNLLLKSMHKDWYICQSRDRQRDHITPLELDFYDGDPDVLERCTFSFWPVPPYENKQKNCRNVIGPEKPLTIVGQPQTHPAHLVSETSAQPLQPSCILLVFVWRVNTGGTGNVSRINHKWSFGAFCRKWKK